ncbi:MAG TPA: 1,4-alpha-glucan branching protein domain-containing protein, partial [Bdellovibrionota bacterium]|nr:1,4-alpha-glucan branching protein domain-containing protein [Bdellovibrionota bacterium]
PKLGGPSHATLMMVHPRLLHLHWMLSDAEWDRVNRSLGPAELRLEVSDGVGPFVEVGRQSFDFRVSNWYLPNTHVDCLLKIRLGLMRENRFDEILVTNQLRIPRENPGVGPEVWMNLNEMRNDPGLVTELHPHRADWSPKDSVNAGYRFPPLPIGMPRVRVLPSARARLKPGETRSYLSLVLHSHIPFIRHPEREYFLEEHWLFEAITETYLPILEVLERLDRDSVPGCVTISLSPTLVAMLRDDVLVGKYERFLNRMCELADKEADRTANDPAFQEISKFYRDRIRTYRHLFRDVYRRDLVSAFISLEERGRVEVITCAATHGFLPQFQNAPSAVRAQIRLAISEHERHFGRKPKGFWLPECAYFEGLDRFLAEAGIEYFFVDAHALKFASSSPRLGIHAPIFCPSGVAAFARDEETTVQVWSAQLGYPGDPAYRDFYRDIGFDLDFSYVAPYLDPAGIRGMTGFKYYRITGKTDRKEPYRRDWALGAAESHAEDFVANRSRQADWLASQISRKPLVVSMYDAELFGHWWFEGPDWLEAVLRKLPTRGISALSPSQYLELYPIGQVAEPAGSSWGEKGYFEVWLNSANDWIQPYLHDCARRMIELSRKYDRPTPTEKRFLAQTARELLLAQASDWPFILRTGTSTVYARRRIHEHLHRFDRLASQLERRSFDEGFLHNTEAQDNLFPNVDYRLWREA